MERAWPLLFVCLPVFAGNGPGNFPFSFEPNQGQTDPRVKFLARVPGYVLFVTAEEAVFRGQDGSVERMKLIGANRKLRIEPLDRLPGISNYFIGNDPAKWRTNIPSYAKYALREVYPGVDLVFYSDRQQLEYDWVVAPGADPKQIRVRWESPGEISKSGGGDLVLSASLRQKKPQISQGGKAIAGGYAVRGKEVRFEIANYDAGKTLIIDPVLVYSTYLGGSMGTLAGGQTGESATGIAVDSAGNAYVTGSTFAVDFPTANAIQSNQKSSSGTNAFVTKINAAGSALVYSTYLGGTGGYDGGNAIAVDSAGNAYVTGSTDSADFPTVNPIQLHYRGVGGSNNAFVTKINAAGSALAYSTFLGGSNNLGVLCGGDAGYGIAVDSAGNAYVTGCTDSSNFPTANALQGSDAGFENAFVTKINAAGSQLVYSAYLGGNGNNMATGIALDSAGDAYVYGDVASTSFPLVNPLQSATFLNQFGSPASSLFVSEVNADGSGLVYSTYLSGSNGANFSSGIAVDSAGSAYITGTTTATDFPVSHAFQGSLGAGGQFVTKFSPGGSKLVYSAYLGGGGEANAIALDSAGNAYVTGATSATSFPTVNPIQANLDAAGRSNVFVSEINAAGSALVFSSYLGGSGGDSGAAIAVSTAGNIYVTGSTTSTDFPTSGPLQGKNREPAGDGTVFVSVISTGPAVTTIPASLAITAGNHQTALAGSPLPVALAVSVTNSSGGGVGGVTVNFSVASGGASLSAASAQTNSSGTASVMLTLGTSPGLVTVTASIAGSTIAPVTFAETANTNPGCPIGPPQISSVNSATDFGEFSNFASGSYLEVKGANLAIDARQWASADFNGSSAPTKLDGSGVSINGIAGYVSYISGQQINVQAPSDTATGMVPIVVSNCAGASNTFMFQKNAVSPGMLATAAFNIGKQYLVALFATDLAQGAVTYVGNTGLIAGANFRPAQPGDVIIVYGLGFGPVTPSTPPGVIAAGSTSLTGLSVDFGQTPATIDYAGLYPGFVGLYEFYVTVPGVASGDSQINIAVNGTPVPQTLFLTVQQ